MKRTCAYSAGLLLLACMVACMAAPFRGRADYGLELELRAIARAKWYDEVIWHDVDGRGDQCPIVFHLPAGDLGDRQLRSVQAMKELGGRTSTFEIGPDGQPKKLGTWVSLELEDVRIDATYVEDRLTGLRARVSGEVRLTIQGKEMTLPVEKGEMVRVLGEPKRFVE